jgi:predicted RNase H-like HicB family nuclease
MNREFRILVAYDDEAQVWFVNDSDVPGLNAEADTQEELRIKLLAMIPELLELNYPAPHEVSLDLLIQSEQRLEISA